MKPLIGVHVLHPHGNENVRRLAAGLEEDGVLSGLWTGLAYSGVSDLLRRVLPVAVIRELERRLYSDINPRHINLAARKEISRLLMARSPRSVQRLAKFDPSLAPFLVAENLQDRLSGLLRRQGSDQNLAAWGYEGYASRMFRAAADTRVVKVLEQPYAYGPVAETIWREEAIRRPEWAPTLRPHGLPGHVKRAKEEELDLADIVVVPSNQVALSLEDRVPEQRIRLIPYGCSASFSREIPLGENSSSRWQPRERPRILFVGRLQSDKGIAYLADAYKDLGSKVDLTVIGRRPPVVCPALDDLLDNCNYLGSVPRSRVLSEMEEHDLLVLPSLVEGRSLTALEALSVGLPIVVSPGSGVTDLVTDGLNGYSVGEADSDAIVSAIMRYDALSFSEREEMRKNSRLVAESNSWSTYTEKVSRLVDELSCLQ